MARHTPSPLKKPTGHCVTTSASPLDSFWKAVSGVVVLPCGAGKTMVGAAAMAKAQATTLILVTNTVAGRQWCDELLRRTSSPKKKSANTLEKRKKSAQ